MKNIPQTTMDEITAFAKSKLPTGTPMLILAAQMGKQSGKEQAILIDAKANIDNASLKQVLEVFIKSLK